MQRVVTAVRRHGTEKWEVAIGPERPQRSHRQFLRSKRKAKSDPEFAEISVLEEIRRVRMDLPAGLKLRQPQPKSIGGPAPNPIPVPPKPPLPVKAEAKKKPTSLFGARIKKAN